MPKVIKKRTAISFMVLAVLSYIITYTMVETQSYTNIRSMQRFLVSSYSEFISRTERLYRSSRDSQDIYRIVIVLGTRPDAIKCAPLITELKSHTYMSKFKVTVVSTGQHRQILKQSLDVFHQTVDVDLDLMVHNQSLSDLFTTVFAEVSNQIEVLHPHLLVVQGDTTTALAAGLAGAYQGVPIAHVEAGLRSYDLSNPYPEELNRKLIDSFAKLKFAPTTFAKEALLREGACEADIFVTGNTGIDAFYKFYEPKNVSQRIPIVEAIYSFKSKHANNTNKNSTAVILITMHRRENFQYLSDMCEAVKIIANMYETDVMIILPVHPNPNVRNVVLEKLRGLQNVNIVEPIPFDVFGRVIFLSDIIVTDSGGVQEEAASIGRPVILMRSTTERPEGIYLGTIKQVGVKQSEIVESVKELLTNLHSTERKTQVNLFGNGTASKQIAIIMYEYLSGRISLPRQCMTKFRQDAIARTIYTYKNVKQINIVDNSSIHSCARRKRMVEDIARVRPRITLGELLQLPSEYNITRKDDNEFSLTAIIGMYKREGVVRRWIEALISQTHPPKQIWITSFASPITEKLSAEIEEVHSLFFKPSNHCIHTCTERNCSTNSLVDKKNDCLIRCFNRCEKSPQVLFVNVGDMQLKYFGRFQLALQCHTKYVVVLDDDCIPQSRYFETAMHTINTQQYRGILGTKGTPVAEYPFFGPLSRSDRIIEADVVGGSWFMESDWVKLMFHDKLHSWNTGEDWHLCANARKYANLRSFVMPVDPNDTSTHSFSKDYLNISDKGDTTGRVAGTTESRKYILQQLWLRGDRLMDSYTISQSSLLLFFEKNNDAMMLLEYSKLQLTDLDGRITCATSNAARNNIDVVRMKKECYSFHDFMIGRDYNVEPTPITSAAGVMYAFDMVVQGTQSTAVIIVGSSSTAATLGIVTAALLRNIPVINIYIEEDVLNLRTAEAIVATSTYTIPASFNRTLHSNELWNLNKYFRILFQ